jgi:hypothetical protein
LPEVSWLFFKAVRAGLAVTKRPHLSHTGRASNAEKQPTGPGPEGCDENGPAAALFVGHVSLQICSLLTPCRRPILIATKYLVFRGQDTRGHVIGVSNFSLFEPQTFRDEDAVQSVEEELHQQCE